MRSLIELLDRPVVLVGLMGAGKSSVGRLLAKRLKLPFVDSDEAIARAAGATIADLFERFGEPDFREGEHRLIAGLLEGPVGVIAGGGGAFVDPRTRSLLKTSAVTVWLDAPVEVLAKRTRQGGDRPLLRGGDHAALLERLYVERRPIYAEADIHLRSAGGGPANIVEPLIAALHAHLLHLPDRGQRRETATASQGEPIQ